MDLDLAQVLLVDSVPDSHFAGLVCNSIENEANVKVVGQQRYYSITVLPADAM